MVQIVSPFCYVSRSWAIVLRLFTAISTYVERRVWGMNSFVRTSVNVRISHSIKSISIRRLMPTCIRWALKWQRVNCVIVISFSWKRRWVLMVFVWDIIKKTLSKRFLLTLFVEQALVVWWVFVLAIMMLSALCYVWHAKKLKIISKSMLFLLLLIALIL